MSVIHDMLKNLEKREAISDNMCHIVMSKKSGHSFAWISEKNIFFMTLFFSLLIGISVILSIKKHESSSTTVAPTFATFQATALTSHPVMLNQPSAPLFDTAFMNADNITSMSMQSKGNITEVSLYLNHPTFYEISAQDSKHEISLLINQSTINCELPHIDTTNLAINKIDALALDGNILLHFHLYNNTTLAYATVNDDKKNPAIILGFKNNSTTTTTAVANQTITNPQLKPLMSETASNDAVTAVTENQPSKSVKTVALSSLLTNEYENALSLAEMGQMTGAIKKLNGVLKQNALYNEARESLVALYIDQNEVGKARTLLNVGLNLSPDYLPFIELDARLLSLKGNTKAAINMLENHLPNLAENPDYYAFMAALYEKQNDNELATKIYKKLVYMNPHNGNWWFGLGLSLDKLHSDKEASEAYSNAAIEGHLNADSMAFLENRLEALRGDSHETE